MNKYGYVSILWVLFACILFFNGWFKVVCLLVYTGFLISYTKQAVRWGWLQ